MLQQARWAHKAQHTNMNFVHCVCMHSKASRSYLLRQGATLLYVCKALSTSAVLAEHRMEEGRFYALAQPFSILLCLLTQRPLFSGSQTPQGAVLCAGWKLPAAQLFLRAARLSCAPMHWAALVEMMTGTTVKNLILPYFLCSSCESHSWIVVRDLMIAYFLSYFTSVDANFFLLLST